MRIKCAWVAAVCSAVLLAVQAAADQPAIPRNPRLALALRSQEPGVEELSRVRTARVGRALASPEALWTFVTSSQSTYLERRAAAVQGRSLVPLGWLGRIWAAIQELRREHAIHFWRIRPSPFDSLMRVEAPSDRPLAPRHVLGQQWTPPQRPIDYPLTPSERERAPWPWQVQQALHDLSGALVPGNVAAGERVEARAEAYLAQLLTLPCASDDDAQIFVEVSQFSPHHKSIAVLGALRNIAVNADTPRAAVHVSTGYADATRSWNHPAAWALGAAGTLDILRRSPHREARDNAAYWLRSLRTAYRGGREEPRPLPAGAILEVSRLALDPSSGDEWKRFYGYALSVLEALDDPPFAPDRGLRPESPEVARRLAAFHGWYDAHRAELEALAREQEAELADAARELAAVETCRPRGQRG